MENCLEMVSYDEDGRTAGWWNDIHCTKNKSRAFVCAYDNGNMNVLIIDIISHI